MCVCVCVFVFGQYFFIDTYLIEHNRHFLSIYSLPYRSYDIRRELVDKPSI